MKTKGIFITFEGPEGSGKTTVLQSIAQRFRDEGQPVVSTREPGGIRIAERIREVILDNDHAQMDGKTEALLYAAARRQHLVEKIIPALQAGQIVLCDRFLDSSLAYQGYARGLGIDEVLSINSFAIGDTVPHLTIFFDLHPEIGLERIAKNKNREKNRLDQESIQFHKSVYEGYQQVIQRYPDRIQPIDASLPLEKVTESVWKLISGRIM